jgi:hypothetical protein
LQSQHPKIKLYEPSSNTIRVHATRIRQERVVWSPPSGRSWRESRCPLRKRIEASLDAYRERLLPFVPGQTREEKLAKFGVLFATRFRCGLCRAHARLKAAKRFSSLLNEIALPRSTALLKFQQQSGQSGNPGADFRTLQPRHQVNP